MAGRILRRPTRLVLDYDGTLTVKDTMAVLGLLPKQPRMTWDELVDAYMKDYTVFQNQPFAWKNYDRDEYSRWLASRKWVEQRSAQRVQDADFFRAVKLEDVKNAVTKSFKNGNLVMRTGWADLLRLFLSSHGANTGLHKDSYVGILSVNWSETSIREALWQGAYQLATSDQDELCQYMNDIQIFANEIEGLGSPQGCSGRVIRPFDGDIRTSADKLRYFEESRRISGQEKFTVYVGDSSTDFDCLCAADVGIWIYDVPEDEYEEASKQIFKPLKFVPPPLRSVLTAERLSAGKSLFYWTPDLATIIDFLTEPRA